MNDEQIEALRTKYGFDRIGIIEGEMYLPMKEVFEKLVQRWIPCSERLPEKYCHCLVTRKNIYDDGFDVDVREDVFIELEGVWDWQSIHEGLLDDIVAWMPLPEPYQEEGEVHE